MKMPKPVYDQLKADFLKLLTEHYHKESAPETAGMLTDSDLWAVFHEINAQRSYGDDHPRWLKVKRILPPSHVDSQCWSHELYSADLYDSHILTAMRRVREELGKELKHAN